MSSSFFPGEALRDVTLDFPPGWIRERERGERRETVCCVHVVVCLVVLCLTVLSIKFGVCLSSKKKRYVYLQPAIAHAPTPFVRKKVGQMLMT